MINFNSSLKNTLNVPTTKNNYSSDLCMDQYVASIHKINGLWVWNTNNIIIGSQTTRIGTDVDYANIKKNKKYILIVLESPHVDEYDINSHRAIGPAIGTTGRLFSYYFLDILNSNPNSTCSISSYTIVFLNAVQYQASQGMIPINKGVRDTNWMSFWNNGFNADLPRRISEFKKVDTGGIVINCVTGGTHQNSLHCIVEQSLNSIGNYYTSPHPCSWFTNKNRYIKDIVSNHISI